MCFKAKLADKRKEMDARERRRKELMQNQVRMKRERLVQNNALSDSLNF